MERKRDGSNLDARVMDKNGGEKERERKTTTNVSVKCKKKKVGKVESEPAWFTFLPSLAYASNSISHFNFSHL